MAKKTSKPKSKTGKMNRVVYIDAELDARMRKAGDVNWSAVASTAFERELQQQQWRLNMSDVVDRLRASMSEEDAQEYDAGRDDGTEWATQTASVRELRNLSRYINQSNGQYLYEAPKGNAYGADEFMAFAILGVKENDRKDRSEASEFWELVTGEESADCISRPEYLRGFAEGALAVWAEVSPQL